MSILGVSTGEGIVVGIVDSGWYEHDFFKIAKTEFQKMHEVQKWKGSGKGWNYPTLVFPSPVYGGLPDPETDTSSVSHGTGMVANLLSVAPGVTLRMYSRDKQSFLKSLDAAVTQCQIISISKSHDPSSWGPSARAKFVPQYKAIFKKAKEAGKIVFHASGNDGSLPWPIENCAKNLIKVGGIHKRANGTLEAANYAMAHSGDLLPDICGLCGMRPGGAYIWLPSDPDNDKNSPYPKGWNLASGTSSATPQIAGICALMAQARVKCGNPPLNMETAKSILRRTATRVSNGKSADDVAANYKWTLLANAEEAVRMACQ